MLPQPDQITKIDKLLNEINILDHHRVDLEIDDREMCERLESAQNYRIKTCLH